MYRFGRGENRCFEVKDKERKKGSCMWIVQRSCMMKQEEEEQKQEQEQQ